MPAEGEHQQSGKSSSISMRRIKQSQQQRSRRNTVSGIAFVALLLVFGYNVVFRQDSSTDMASLLRALAANESGSSSTTATKDATNAASSEASAAASSSSSASSRLSPPLEPPPQRLGLSAERDLQRAPASLHPKWKLWHEMNAAQQAEALDQVGAYVRKYGHLITQNQTRKRGNLVHGTCPAVTIGSGHKLCGPAPDANCVFFSFGINDDPSFDRDLAEQWKCRGFAGDPTVHHPSKLHDKVTFHNLGASMLSDNEERLVDKGGKEEWWTTSMPKLKDFLGLDHVNIIKLDCEGCEVALARDILAEDPTFLHHVDQMSIETHVSKTWITSTEHFYYFGLHFALLEEAGFALEWSSVFGCSKRHETPGCVPELAKYDFPCGYDPWPGHPKVVLGRSCHDFLWKRYPTKPAAVPQ